MSDWTEIVYREFWDVPRMVIARRGDNTFLFNSRFDESLDEYIDYYEVWSMPALTDAQLKGSWEGLEGLALARLPDVALSALPFVVPRPGQRA